MNKEMTDGMKKFNKLISKNNSGMSNNTHVHDEEYSSA